MARAGVEVVLDTSLSVGIGQAVLIDPCASGKTENQQNQSARHV
jgi:hypothetical protein